jgi:single-stranded-DNA-specific exonuclease
MLEAFGGHPMAAGFSIAPERIGELRRALDRTIRDRCGPVASAPIEVDAFVPLDEITLDLAADINRLAPFGAGNPQLVLATTALSVSARRRVGRSGAHLRLDVSDGSSTTRSVIWWNFNADELPEGQFDLAYTLRTNDYRGETRVQLEWVAARQDVLEPAPLTSRRIAPKIVDHRQCRDPMARLSAERAGKQMQVWAEAAHRSLVCGSDRRQLEPHPALAIWTTPPGPRELDAALERAVPEIIHLYAVDPGLARPARFLRRLAGLAKRALASARRGEARTTYDWLAAATAQRESAVRAGLLWLSARGDIDVDSEGDDVVLRRGRGPDGRDLSAIEGALARIMAETAAYRNHFATADPSALLPRDPR